MAITPEQNEEANMKAVFKDVDGTTVYQIPNGDLVDKNGSLVSLTCEDNVRKILALRAKANQVRRDRAAAYKDLGLIKVKGALGGTYYE